MATFSIDEAIERINGYMDKVAAEAESFMKSYINTHAKKGYATGALAASIDTRKISTTQRGVGTSLKAKNGFVYGAAVDKGRRAITKTDGYLHYFDPVFNKEIWTHHVKKMDGINFIDETQKHISGMNIPL